MIFSYLCYVRPKTKHKIRIYSKFMLVVIEQASGKMEATIFCLYSTSEKRYNLNKNNTDACTLHCVWEMLNDSCIQEEMCDMKTVFSMHTIPSALGFTSFPCLGCCLMGLVFGSPFCCFSWVGCGVITGCTMFGVGFNNVLVPGLSSGLKRKNNHNF